MPVTLSAAKGLASHINRWEASPLFEMLVTLSAAKGLVSQEASLLFEEAVYVSMGYFSTLSLPGP